LAVTSPSPTVLRRWIAIELRTLRETAGITRPQVAERLQCVASHVSHLETGRNLPNAAELRDLLTYYGVSDRTDGWLSLLAAAKRGKDWWAGWDVPEWFELFLGLESSAVQIESYDALTVPGILQTPDYAEAIIRGGDPELDDAEVDRRLRLRLTRQQILEQDHPPRVWSVLDESALLRPAGKPDQVLRSQLEHLLTLSQRPTVDLQILRLDSGIHAGLHGTFTLLSFPTELIGGTVAYTEDQARGRYYENDNQVLGFRRTLTRVQVHAQSQAESQEILAQRIQELS